VNFMSKRLVAVFLFALYCFTADGQSAYQFTKGLAVGPCHQYGREALIKDQLAYQLYSGSLKQPAAGQTLFSGDQGKAITWSSVTADMSGSIQGEALSNGYLYLTYDAKQEQNALLNITSHSMVFVNGEPHGGDIYGSGWLYIPVRLKKGTNEFLVRCSRWARFDGVNARLLFPEKPVMINSEDPTLPHIVLTNNTAPLWGAVVVINTTAQPLRNLTMICTLEGKEVLTELPEIPPMTTRKIGFRIDASAIKQKKAYTCSLQLKQKQKVLDEKSITLDAVNPEDHYSSTFISEIDGSVQYYGVAPQREPDGKAPALFLSVHGAGVEAIGQARAYTLKNWGVLVAPTNRRPRGFNWEDWGRLDALEVLAIAQKKFKPDPQRIYLTGHSMGGHGTWYLGSTYPGKWAAIAPCAGYPSLTGYGSADGRIPEKGRSAAENLLLQASNPSNVIELAMNYKAAGIYIHHGDSDKVVSVDYARQMRQLLGTFHKDFSYYEYPGGSHWFGNESVDWPPIFDYFKWHTIPVDSAVNVVDFSTASPAISSRFHWVSIQQQQRSFRYSRVQLKRNKSKKEITGKTENVSILALSLQDFRKGDVLTVKLDSLDPVTHTIVSIDEPLYLYKDSQWRIGQKPDAKQKGTNRNGSFKEAFNHRMVFVYSTAGTKAENEWSYSKARYDAEVWYYRGNGAVDIIADRNFSPAAFADRGVIIYGNATTNTAWKKLLSNCPVTVQRGRITVGEKQYNGDNLGAYFMWPRADSQTASVAVISGTGLPGMQATEANQYFASGSGFPDYLVFTVDMLKDGGTGIKEAGFFGNDWKIATGEQVAGK
jgi:dienelactone hydrolase